ncbi:cyclo-L-Trp-L-Trp prenyltransferase [Aspergillus ustus]|uniref:Cyclo-L-Trp-L-Trp prenyltransferase n=1 Tax=Aspergillus ustus TaxID=40382 RepID=A0A0C1EGR0_ASPUT|nr:cyclo-L-Trp-L-Trp prenyltransferase [Aspergillus ustus]
MQSHLATSYKEQRPSDRVTLRSVNDANGFSGSDQHLWWDHMSPMLRQMLCTTGYGTAQISHCLSMLQNEIIPSIGPFPRNNSRPTFKHALSGIGALEFLLNIDSLQDTVRIAFEPTSHLAGTKDDPCNKRTTRDVLYDFRDRGVIPDDGLNLEPFEQFVDRLTISDVEIQRLQSENKLQDHMPLTQHLLTFNYAHEDKGNIGLGICVYPMAKAIACDVPALDMMFNSIRMVDTTRQYSASLKMLVDYFSSSDPQTCGGLMLSCDLVPLARARLQVVVYEFQINFDRAAELWTLGGQLATPQTSTGLAKMRKLFSMLETEIAAVKSGLPMMFGYRLSPGNPHPHPTITLPLVGINDKAAADHIAVFMEWNGWRDRASCYAERLASYA